MSTAADRHAKGLNIDFDYDTEPAIGDRLEITTGRKAQALSAIGGPRELGECIDVRNALKECTIRILGLHNLQTRIAGEIVVAGQGVFGPSDKVYQYIPGSAAVITAANAGPYAITLDVNDMLTVRVGNGPIQTFALTAGAARTAAQIAAELNAAAVGFVASASSDGKLVLTCLTIGTALEIVQDTVEIVSSTAGPYNIVETSGDGLVVKVGSGGNQTFVLTAGATQSAAAVAADINAAATDFYAVRTADQKLRLYAADPRTALEIVASGSTAATALGLTAEAVTTEDCYTTIGLTPGVTDGGFPSHDPSAKRCMIIVGGAKDAAIETIES